MFLFTTASTRALGPTQLPIQWVPGALPLGIKRPRREADHSPPSRAEVKEWAELYLHSPNTPSWRGAQLKHRDNFFNFSIFLPSHSNRNWPSSFLLAPSQHIAHIVLPCLTQRRLTSVVDGSYNPIICMYAFHKTLDESIEIADLQDTRRE
jgi:hypothetical protein